MLTLCFVQAHRFRCLWTSWGRYGHVNPFATIHPMVSTKHPDCGVVLGIGKGWGKIGQPGAESCSERQATRRDLSRGCFSAGEVTVIEMEVQGHSEWVMGA